MHKFPVKPKTIFFVLILCLTLIFLDDFGYLKRPKSVFLYVFSPLQQVLQGPSSWVEDLFFTINSIEDFKSRSSQLQIENQRLNSELVKFKEIERENQLLRKELKFKSGLCGEADCIDFVEGSIVSRGFDDYGKSITINIGERNGAKKNQAVVADGGVMIGKITEVFDSYSKVSLIISSDSSVNSITQTTRANGLVKGQYGTGLRLEMIDQSEELIDGDIVITSGLEEDIPKGLILGKVSGIEQSPNAVFKSADIDLSFDFSHIEEVFLVKKNG